MNSGTRTEVFYYGISSDTVTFNGSIAVGGTVDGRDVASDGSKLDGIASGATANTGTVTSVATSGGLTGGTITSSGTISISSDARPNSNQYFGNSGGEYTYYDNSNALMRFYINSSEEMRLESDGDLHVDGNVTAYSTTISDERLKTDIERIEGALDKVCSLSGYTFTYKHDGKASAGVIAQEVEKVMPSAVIEKELPYQGEEGEQYKIVQYDQLHGLLIEAIKEQQKQIDELKAKLGDK
jgi:hypothetical protein